MNINKILKIVLFLLPFSIPQSALATSTACMSLNGANEKINTPGYDVSVDCGYFVDRVLGNNGASLDIYGLSHEQLFKIDGETLERVGDLGNEDEWVFSGLPSGNSGTWEAPYEVLYMVIKAGPAYTIYDLGLRDVLNGGGNAIIGNLSGAASGAWATAPHLLGGDQLGREISHISFYGSRLPSIPEPSTLLLGMIGMLGMVYTRRRKQYATLSL